jgi:hypothetical protein
LAYQGRLVADGTESDVDARQAQEQLAAIASSFWRSGLKGRRGWVLVGYRS